MLMDEHERGDFEPLNNQVSPRPEPAPSGEVSNLKQPANFMSPQPSRVVYPSGKEKTDGGHRNLIISIVAIISLALIAGLIYWFSLRHHPVAQPSSSQTASSQSANSSHPSTHIDSTTKSYNSQNFNLAFSYPADWTINDNGNGFMTAKSPTLNLTNAAGQTQQGIIILTFRTKGSALPEFNKGPATATRDSVKIAYTQPTQDQRANTYLSFLQYATTTTHGALDGVYITGDLGYQKDQDIPASDVSQLDPIISITFTDTAGKALSIADSSWDNTNLSGPLVKMLESLSIN